MKKNVKGTVIAIILSIIIVIIPIAIVTLGIILNHWALISLGIIATAIATFMVLPEKVTQKFLRKVYSCFFSEESHQ